MTAQHLLAIASICNSIAIIILAVRIRKHFAESFGRQAAQITLLNETLKSLKRQETKQQSIERSMREEMTGADFSLGPFETASFDQHVHEDQSVHKV